MKKGGQLPHFQTVRSGGPDENQTICYLWDLVKSVEALRNTGNRQEPQETAKLGTRLRRQIRMEIRRCFVRQRRRNVKMVVVVLALTLCVAGMSDILIGVDRVVGNSIYPYSNHGDWIVYDRNSGKMQRNDAIVSEKNGECMVERTTGLPGDMVEISPPGNWVVISGTQVREDCVTLVDVSGDVEGRTDAEWLGVP